MGVYGYPKFGRGLYKGTPVVYDYSNIGLKATVDIRVSGVERNQLARWWNKFFHTGEKPDTTNIRLGELVDPYYMGPDTDEWDGDR